MALYLYNNENCNTTSKIVSAYCVEMSQALNIDYKQYLIPTNILLTSDILSVYLGISDGSNFTIVKINSSDWTIQAGNKVTINNQPVEYLQLHNRVIFVPKLPANLCFTGVEGSYVENRRPLWLKRSDATKAYDYIMVTSIDYFAKIYTIKEYSNISFVNGVGSGFSNLTSDYLNMVVDFDGQRIGVINEISSTSTLHIDTNYTSIGPSRSFVYNQGSLEFAIDINGTPGTWGRYLRIPTIDTDIAVKFWFRDFMTVTNSLTTTAHNSIRILGTEFIL